MRLDFTKMHGTGNDFILIDCRDKAVDDLLSAGGDICRRLCHRRFGIGADQVLLLYDSDTADFRMRIFNADGGEVEMCGNGIRCLARYIWDRGLSDKDELIVETLAGMIRPVREGDLVKVDMGEPVLEPEKIPVKMVQRSTFDVRRSEGNTARLKPDTSGIVDFPLMSADREFRITCVSMGNPHAVIVVDSVDDLDLEKYGPPIENDPLFPNRINVEFIEITGRGRIRMRVWERGAGETMACGTGASAAVVAACLQGLTDKKVVVGLLGGELVVEWNEDNHVWMTGPAVEVFEGRVNI
jgi:diaminopimelate epimerase